MTASAAPESMSSRPALDPVVRRVDVLPAVDVHLEHLLAGPAGPDVPRADGSLSREPLTAADYLPLLRRR